MSESTTAPEPDANPDDVPPAKTKATMGPVGVIVILAIIGLCLWGAIKQGSKSDVPDEIDAKIMCEKFVEKQLKAPSTADYSGETARQEASVWVVTGSVDAQNSFGAMIRSSFTCRMSVSGETWTLTQPVTIT